jgi:hypothetical protein
MIVTRSGRLSTVEFQIQQTTSLSIASAVDEITEFTGTYGELISA